MQERLTLYKRLANCELEEDLRALQEELIDRFGELPPQTAALVETHRLRMLVKDYGVHKLDLGGTEMEKALDSTLALAGDAEASPGAGEGAAPVDLLLITDGQIHAIDRTVAKARALGHRVFVVGIGSAPAEGVLRRLADETGGACDFVAPGEAVEPAVLRMFARLRSQRMASLELAWPAGAKPLWMSALPGSVFDGDAVTVWARFAQVPDGTVRLIGRRTHAPVPESLGEACLTAAEHDATLSRMAVAAQIETLLAGEGAHSRQALELAVAYQLVSPLTHFLLVETRAEGDKPADMPDLVKVPSMLPAGFGGLGSLDFGIDPCMAPLTVNEAPEHYGSPGSVSGRHVRRLFRRPGAGLVRPGDGHG